MLFLLEVVGQVNLLAQILRVIGKARCTDVGNLVPEHFKVGCNECPHSNVEFPPLVK